MQSVRFLIVLLVGVFHVNLSMAEDWPQWRGPTRDGVWHETGIISKFKSDEIGSIRITVGDIISQVPLDPAKTDYAEIMKQVKAGTLTIKDAH